MFINIDLETNSPQSLKISSSSTPMTVGSCQLDRAKWFFATIYLSGPNFAKFFGKLMSVISGAFFQSPEQYGQIDLILLFTFFLTSLICKKLNFYLFF